MTKVTAVVAPSWAPGFANDVFLAWTIREVVVVGLTLEAHVDSFS